MVRVDLVHGEPSERAQVSSVCGVTHSSGARRSSRLRLPRAMARRSASLVGVLVVVASHSPAMAQSLVTALCGQPPAVGGPVGALPASAGASAARVHVTPAGLEVARRARPQTSARPSPPSGVVPNQAAGRNSTTGGARGGLRLSVFG